MALPINLIDAFCRGFLGYGNPQAAVWYVAIEEHGGKTEAEILARLHAWDKRGRRDIEDMRGFCRDTGYPTLTRYADVNAPRQPTWCGLIEDRLHRAGKTTLSDEEVLLYQRTKWLSPDGDSCLVNFLPLPSPNTGTWNYASWGNGWKEHPALNDRAMYTRAIAPIRVTLLVNAIRRWCPECVVFASTGPKYREYWSQITREIGALPGISTDIMIHPAATTRRSHRRTERRTVDFATILNRLRVQQSPPGQHYERLGTIGDALTANPLYLSLLGGYGGPLCFEWKVQRSKGGHSFQPNQALLSHIESNVSVFEAAVAQAVRQPVEWQATGKGQSNNGILVVRYSENQRTEEPEAIWASRIYPLLWDVIKAQIQATP